MNRKKNHTNNVSSNARVRIVSLVVFLTYFLSSAPVCAVGPNTGFEVTSVSLRVEHLGSFEIPVMISEKNEIYLAVTDLFTLLKIKSTVSTDGAIIQGSFIHEENPYKIDGHSRRITYQGKTYPLTEQDMIVEPSGILLRLNFFGDVFGLQSTFDFRSLSIYMRAADELPVIRERRLERMRQNTRIIQSEPLADTLVGRSDKLFQFGTADWSINTMQQVGGANQNRLTLGLGATLLGGELTFRLNYNNQSPLLERWQHFSWRYVNNDRRAIRQVVVGKISQQPISTILFPVVGMQLSNVPTFRRTSIGTYPYSGHTKPGWVVELYVNHVLVNYTKADASGFYVFDIPLLYGNTEAELRFYGEWGEEEVSRIFFKIPYTFLPKNEWEYTLSAGFVQDGNASRFAQLRMNYGLSSFITVGGGVEYLSSVTSSSVMPFLTTSMSLNKNVLFSGEYVQGVRARGKLSYTSPSSLLIEFNQTTYEDRQTAVRFNYDRETGLSFAQRFRIFERASLYSRLTLASQSLQTNRFTNINFLLSGSMRGVNVNLTTYSLTRSETAPFIYSDLSVAFLLPAKMTATPMLRYVFSDEQVSLVQCRLKKNLFAHAVIHATFERNVSQQLTTFQLGFTYNFSFARLDMSGYHNKNTTIFHQSASGSLMHGSSRNNLHLTRNFNMGKGGIILTAFLDMNSNGKKEEAEPYVKGLNVKGRGGRISKNMEDGTILISSLEPYVYYFLEVDGNNFEDISWKLGHKTYNILIEPNYLKPVEVPVTVELEASGMIYLKENEERKGLGRIKVNFYNAGKLAGSTLSESDGYFSYRGLPPGDYMVRIDSAQLDKLSMTHVSAPASFTLQMSESGDVADQLDFVIAKNVSNAENRVGHSDFNSNAVASHLQNTQTIETEKLNSTAGEEIGEGATYRVHIVTASRKLPSSRLKELKDVQVRDNNGQYIYSWGEYTNAESARILVNELKERGFADAYMETIRHDVNPEDRQDEETLNSPHWQNDEGQELNFRVQLLATRSWLDPHGETFRETSGVQVYRHNGMFKYTWGRFKTLEAAQILKNEAIERGFQGTFIVPFYKDRRIRIERNEETNSHADNMAKGLVFRITLFTDHERLPLDHPSFKGLRNVGVEYRDGAYRYTWGEYPTYKKATKQVKQLSESGFRNAEVDVIFRM